MTEYTALKSLSQNNSIIFKKADKGLNIVVLERQYYLKEGQKQLSNRKFYKKLKEDPTTRFSSLIKNIITDIANKGEISDKCHDYLLASGDRTAIFYMLPKIHKNYTSPPGRPIVSSIDSPTERISHLLDILLQPLVQQSKSYIT